MTASDKRRQRQNSNTKILPRNRLDYDEESNCYSGSVLTAKQANMSDIHTILEFEQIQNKQKETARVAWECLKRIASRSNSYKVFLPVATRPTLFEQAKKLESITTESDVEFKGSEKGVWVSFDPQTNQFSMKPENGIYVCHAPSGTPARATKSWTRFHRKRFTDPRNASRFDFAFTNNEDSDIEFTMRFVHGSKSSPQSPRENSKNLTTTDTSRKRKGKKRSRSDSSDSTSSVRQSPTQTVGRKKQRRNNNSTSNGVEQIQSTPKTSTVLEGLPHTPPDAEISSTIVEILPSRGQPQEGIHTEVISSPVVTTVLDTQGTHHNNPLRTSSSSAKQTHSTVVQQSSQPVSGTSLQEAVFQLQQHAASHRQAVGPRKPSAPQIPVEDNVDEVNSSETEAFDSTNSRRSIGYVLLCFGIVTLLFGLIVEPKQLIVSVSTHTQGFRNRFMWKQQSHLLNSSLPHVDTMKQDKSTAAERTKYNEQFVTKSNSTEVESGSLSELEETATAPKTVTKEEKKQTLTVSQKSKPHSEPSIQKQDSGGKLTQDSDAKLTQDSDDKFKQDTGAKLTQDSDDKFKQDSDDKLTQDSDEKLKPDTQLSKQKESNVQSNTQKASQEESAAATREPTGKTSNEENAPKKPATTPKSSSQPNRTPESVKDNQVDDLPASPSHDNSDSNCRCSSVLKGAMFPAKNHVRVEQAARESSKWVFSPSTAAPQECFWLPTQWYASVVLHIQVSPPPKECHRPIGHFCATINLDTSYIGAGSTDALNNHTVGHIHVSDTNRKQKSLKKPLHVGQVKYHLGNYGAKAWGAIDAPKDIYVELTGLTKPSLPGHKVPRGELCVRGLAFES